MDKVNCEIIEDVLPLYVEHLASESTVKMVDAHLEMCEECRKKLEMLQGEVAIPMETDTTPMKSIQKKIHKKSITAAVVSGMLVLIIALLAVVHLHSPILINDYENAVVVDRDTDGNILLFLSEEVAGYSLEEMANGSGTYFLSCWNTKWNQMFENEQKRIVFVGDKTVARIYYYATETYERQQDVLIYDAGTAATSGVVVTLPRLVLNYYLLIAGVLGVLGIVISILVRKHDKHKVSQKITLFPILYVVSSVLVLWGKGDIYNASYYFSGIMIVTIALYLLGYYVMNKIFWEKMR